MKLKLIYGYVIGLSGMCLLTTCSESPAEQKMQKAGFGALLQSGSQQNQYGEFKTQEALGEHLVIIAGCHDCHTPKKMTPNGPEPDFSMALSGHPAKMPPPDVDRAEMERKGVAATQTLTAWVGPWGISYAANLTSDETGIGNWQEENFITAIRHGKYKGIESWRTLLPPMPWQSIGKMTDQELKAIFAYLKSTKPIKNVVPAAQPPLAATAVK
ncbi:c-type cytochrome [Pontibacter sp. 172403-2]|uniref:c-type cytochrome n=1 Tax=Pontibacter rufus TaxID=2791028 RepID=UPI0018AF72DC|nr:c-type cytochrome [Pontibacter sp. 172403-2]MBF9255792.1 c-type cytochrome [Pontibacter sp. 172403-2]